MKNRALFAIAALAVLMPLSLQSSRDARADQPAVLERHAGRGD